MDSPVIRGPESLPSTAQTANLPIPVKNFYQGKPLALGITQIFIGIIGIIFGILINIAEDHLIYYIFIAIPHWSGILYIISGSLAVAAARNPKIPLVKGMLVMNVISSIAAGIGIICLFVTLSYNLVFYVRHLCNHDDTEAKEKCYETMMSSFNILNGIIIILTVFTFLEFCITISIASFGCKMLCRNAFPETVVIIYQNETPASAEHSPVDGKESEST